MVSDELQDGRCNAQVTKHAGLELDFDDCGVYTDDEIDSVVFERGAVRTEQPPNYHEIYKYFKHSYNVVAIELDNGETVEPDDHSPDFDWTRTDFIGYCERYPVKSENRDVCPVHGGGKGTGAEEGNTNRIEHGLYAKRSNYYKQLDDATKQTIEVLVDDWIDDMDFDRSHRPKLNELYRIAVDQVRQWDSLEEYVDTGMVTDQVVGQDDDGEPVYAEDENPINLPYDRLDRTMYQKLKRLGGLGDDDDGTEVNVSLSQKFAENDGDD
jgi:hypothetical protein